MKNSEIREKFIDAHAIFGSPLPYSNRQWPDVFVMMPFSDKFRMICTDCISPVVDEFELTSQTAAEFFTAEVIIKEIWSATIHAKLCIADCTDRNSNVFYELGVAHTLEVPVILLTQNAEDLPFDFSHRRAIIYKYTVEGRKKLKTDLRNTVRHILSPHDDALLEAAVEAFMSNSSFGEMTHYQYSRYIDIFMEWRLLQEPASVSTHVKNYLEHLKDSEYAPGTIASYIIPVRHVVEKAVELNPKYAIEAHKIKDIELPRAEDNEPSAYTLSNEEAYRLLIAPGRHSLRGMRDTCIIGLLTAGLQVKEISALKWGEFYIEDDTAYFQSNRDEIPIPKWLWSLLKDWASRINIDRSNDANYVFWSLAKNEGANSPGIDPRTITRLVNKYSEIADLPMLGPIDLRVSAKQLDLDGIIPF